MNQSFMQSLKHSINQSISHSTINHHMVYLSPPKSTQEICVLLSFVELKGDDQNCVLKQRNIGTLVHCSTLVLVLD